MRVRLVTPPEPVVTLEEADAHLELDGDTSKQVYVQSLIAAAQGHIDGPDGWLGRAIGVQTIEARLDGFWNGALALPYPPNIDVVSVHHDDQAGVATLIDPAVYALSYDGLLPRLGYSWPQASGPGSVRVRYRAGYDGEEGRILPAPIRAAILLMVGDMFAQRESFVTGVSATAVPMSTTVDALLSPFRVYR